LQQLPNQPYQGVQNQSAAVHQNFQPSSQASTSTLPLLVDSLSPPRSLTPSPSPLISTTDISQSPRSPCSPYLSHPNSRSSRKRSNADISSSDHGSDSDSSEPNPRYRIRRTNHHDRRCLTIHVSLHSHSLSILA
jgi:hypothetical protein